MNKRLAFASLAIGLGLASTAGAVDLKALTPLTDCQLIVYYDCLDKFASDMDMCYNQAQAHICFSNGSRCTV